MTLRSEFSLIFILLTAFYAYAPVAGMDKQSTTDESWLMGLNTDAFKQVLNSCDADDDKAIIYWTRWRQVCKAWHAILTYEYMADQVDLRIAAETYQEVEPYLVDAVRNGKKGLVGLLCRLYPSISKERPLYAIFDYFQSPQYDTQRTPKSESRTLPQWLALLLKLTENPNDIRLKINHNSQLSLLKYIVRYGVTFLHTEEIRQCLDVLLEHKVDTLCPGLLEDAAEKNILYAVSKLLDKPLCHTTNMNHVLANVCMRYPGNQDTLPGVVDTLLKRGAVVTSNTLGIVATVHNFKVLNMLLKTGVTASIIRDIVPILTACPWTDDYHRACIEQCAQAERG
jgi:hypothetical protein